MTFKTQLENISAVLNNTGNTFKLLESFDALDDAQKKVLLSSNLLTEKQKEQCLIMNLLSSANIKYTTEQLKNITGISSETLATWGLKEATDTLTFSQLKELASSNAQAKSALEKIVVQNAQSVANGKVSASTIAVASSEASATIATGAFTTAIKANIKAMITWMTTNPIGWLTMLAGGIFAITKLYDAFNTSIEEQKEKMEDSLSAYEDTKSELDSITRELKTQEQAIDSLIAKGNLTYAEKDELERLQEITQELLIQEDIKKREKEEAQRETANEAVKSFDKQFGKHDISEESLEYYENSENKLLLTEDKNNIASMIAAYNVYSDMLDKAYSENNQDEIDYYKDYAENIKNTVFPKIQDLIDQKVAISDYYNTIKDVPYETLSTENKAVVDTYNSISDAIALIYKNLDPNKWNSFQIDSAFNTEGVEKTKEELIEMAKAGTLNENVVQNSFIKLNGVLEDSNMALSEGQSAASALCDEIYALAKEENNLSSTTFEPFDVEDFKSTLNQIQSGYQSLIDAKKEYTDNGGFLSLDTIASLTESGLITYLEQTENGIRFNTDAYLENAEIMKQNAIMQLYNAMCHDVEAIAIGNVGELSPIANKAIAELGNSAETAANQAANSAKGWYEYGASVAFANNPNVQGATGTTKKQIEATIAAYQNVARMIDNIDIAKSVKPKGSSSKKENTKEKLLKEGKEFLDKYLTLYRAELDAGMIDFNTFIDKSRAIIEKFYKDAKISGKDYFDSLKSLYETQLSLYDKVLSAVSKRFDKEIQKYQDMIDAVNKQNEALEKQKEDYNGILDAIDSVYEKEIERIESEKQAIQDQIDAIQDEADAYEQLKQKEEALYNLERAQSQRTKKVYTEQKGYIYTQDGEAIRDAQDSLNDIETESKINDLQKQQDALDETIDKLNEYKDKWAEIPEAHQNALNKELALAMFGKDFEKLILENRITDIEAFKDKYVAAEQQIQDNTLLIESYEEKIAYYEGLKEQWSQISSAYEEENEKQIAAMFLGEDWEQKILSGRLDTLNGFKDEYRRIQQEIVNLAWESANAQIKADEEAKKGANGTPGSTTLTNSSDTNNLNTNNTNQGKPKPGGFHNKNSISKYAKGGVLREAKPAHPIFEKLAREMGEDHIATIAFKEGERILTPEQNQLFENTVKNIFPNLEKMINISEAKPFVPNPSALNKQRVEITQNINVTLPNITNETGFENFKKEMDTFKLQAYQFANRRYR